MSELDVFSPVKDHPFSIYGPRCCLHMENVTSRTELTVKVCQLRKLLCRKVDSFCTTVINFLALLTWVSRKVVVFDFWTCDVLSK